ncbi:NAD(P)/FAD-dependent oxidoreductase [Desulfomarina sp.]
MTPKKIIVTGGGAAGMMAAGRASEKGARVLLLEKMARTGRKIGISGKGRCNLTNSAELNDFINHFGKNGKFLRQCFNHFFADDLIAFFEKRGLPLVQERGGRIFPKSGSALDVVKILDKWLENSQVETLLNRPVSKILTRKGNISGVVCRGKIIPCDAVILATGGKSYPRTGSTGDGYRLASSLGHTLTPIRPALVPLVPEKKDILRLAGLTLKNVNIRLIINGKRRKTGFGEISFTDRGISGPVPLSMSGFIVDSLRRGDKISMAIDLKPALDDNRLAKRLIRDFEKRRGEPITSLLRGLLPVQLVNLCLASCDISSDIDTYTFPAAKRKKLTAWLKNFQITLTGYRDFDEAIVTAGGIKLNEINPHTMESRLVKGLFIVGELLDIQADTGGFNLQAAFSTGWLAGTVAATMPLEAARGDL